tara:strand:+ start:3894 stop:4670 length:777 start_codon:yes stop_codon:yes gene_type:complete
MSLTNKKISQTYKDVLQVDNNNSGLNATKDVKDGQGTVSALKIGTNQVRVIPGAASATTFDVHNGSGSTIFKVNTSDSTIKSGTTLTDVTTQIQKFGAFDLQPAADTHTALFADTVFTSLTTNLTFGTGTDPATSLTIGSSEATVNALIPSLWYIPANITIDEVRVIAGGEASDTLNFHLFSYDIATGTGADAGDLTNGAVVASTGSTLTIGNDRVTTTTLTINTADVAADKVIIATVENVGATTDVTTQLIVKYHYQ